MKYNHNCRVGKTYVLMASRKVLLHKTSELATFKSVNYTPIIFENGFNKQVAYKDLTSNTFKFEVPNISLQDFTHQDLPDIDLRAKGGQYYRNKVYTPLRFGSKS